MKDTVTTRRRVRGRYVVIGGLLLAFTLAGLATAHLRKSSDNELRALATSAKAQSRRAAEEQKMRALIERLNAVEGMEHVLTRLRDSCGVPIDNGVWLPPYTFWCGMRAEAYFGVRGDITDALSRIRAANIATWGFRYVGGRDVPDAAGTVAYALDYHRARGRHPDGSPMAAPRLNAPGGIWIDWDRPGLPLPNQVEDPIPCLSPGDSIYERCLTSPKAPMSMAAARSRYGTVLILGLGYGISPAQNYFTVPR